MLRAWVIAMVLLTAPAENWSLSAAEWSRPRSGQVVAAMPGVAAAVRALNAHEDSRLILRHPGGEEGALWAAELHDWLVALGVPAGRIELVPGGVPPDRLDLELKSKE